MQKKVLGVLCAAVLIIILIAGLWPFHAPKNQVSWLSNSNGLHFGEYGVILALAHLVLLVRKTQILQRRDLVATRSQ